MSTPIGAVVFDLDGTLCDTRQDLLASINYLRESYGMEALTTDHAVGAVGRGVEHLVLKVLGNGQNFEEALAKFKDHYQEHCTESTEPYPGIPELLADLHQKKIPVAVVTNKPQQAAESILQATQLAVDGVFGAHEDRPKKPDPGGLLEAVAFIKADQQRTVYVGDMDIDLECARSAELPFIGVDFGFVPDSQLAARTAICVDTVDGLRQALLERD